MNTFENMLPEKDPVSAQNTGAAPAAYDPAAFIQRATGLNIDPSAIPETPVNHPLTKPHEVSGAPTIEVAPQNVTTVYTGNPAEVGADNVPSDGWVKLSGETNYDGMIARKKEMDQEKQNDVLSMMDEAIGSEEKRLDAAKEVTSNPEAYSEFINKGGPTKPDSSNARVHYDNVTMEKRTGTKTFNPVADEAAAVIDTDDLIPSYDDSDDTMEDDKKSVTSPKESDNDDDTPELDNEAAYSKFIQDLEVVTIEPGKTVVKTVKNRQLDNVQSAKPGKFLGDQAFLNAVTRFKKDNFTVVSVPLVNSGFTVDVVGTGGVDLTQLYNRISRETSQMDYEIEKMKVVMRNVVGAHPRIDPVQLKKYIHYRDYNMMAWGHICATLDSVEIVANCSDCGKPFRITSSPRALLMNMDEIMQRQREIEAADDINRYSLLTSDRKIVTSNMFEITLGHPNYSEIISHMGQLRQYASNLSEIEAAHFLDKANILYQIRQVKLPNGVVTSNIYQTYLAVTLLSSEDYQLLVSEVDSMQKDILEPKFGIATVKCPHCGYVLHDIPYENLDELVFFHTTVSRMLNTKQIEKPENTSTNG